MTKNKGYTLIEMLIVISIMAILAGLSMFSIGVIRDAKRSAAVNTFDSQLSSCLVKTKAVSDVSGDIVCMYVMKRTKGTKVNYCIKVGYDTGTGVKDIVNSAIELDATHADNVNEDSNWDAVLPKDVADITLGGTSIGDGIKIKFDKSNGSVIQGAGEYGLVKADGTTYATIYLDGTTGNHYIK